LNLLIPKGSDPNVEVVKQLFTQATGVNCNIALAPVDDINTKMHLSARVDKSNYDIALPATFGIPDLVEAEVITDLSDLRAKFAPEKFDDNALYTLGDYYDSRFFGHQTDGDAYMMFYNQMFTDQEALNKYEDQSGVYYQVPKTWAELDSQMAYFHAPDQNLFGGALFRNAAYLIWEFWSRFHSKGVLPLKDDLTPNINSDEGIAALEEMIRVTDYLHPNAQTDGLVDNWKNFAKGNIYANIGWGGTQKYIAANNSQLKNNMNYSPLPGGIVGKKMFSGSYFNWGWNYTVSSQSKNKSLAYLFSLFAVSPTPSTLAIRQSGGFLDPFRIEHYNDKIIQNIYTSRFLEAHQQAMHSSIPDFYLHGQNLYFFELRKYLRFVLEGHMTAKKALDTVASSWETIHVKLGVDKQQAQWKFLKSQYPSYN